MSRARHERISEIFIEAFSLSADEQELVLARECGDDADLRAAVESLLREDRVEGDALDETALETRRVMWETTPTDPQGSGAIPERIGQYRILRQIGEGGMGTVFEAEQEHPRRRVALKVIRPGALTSLLLTRFRLEAQLLGRLDHEGIARIFEAGEIERQGGKQPFFAMEFIDGRECRAYARAARISTNETIELVARISDAVQHAHQKGIVHRDLKPDNVLVVERGTTSTHSEPQSFPTLGQPKILDFGIARATDSDLQLTLTSTGMGQLIGTVPYMSPEQVSGDSHDVDARSDVYALGVILYELLTERVPHDLRHKSIPEASRLIREEDPTRLGSIKRVFRGDIETIVSKALEKNRDRRYQSAAEFAADIRRFLSSKPIEARPTSVFYQLAKFSRRNKALVAGAVLSCLILIAGTVVSLAFAARAIRGETRPLENEQKAQRNASRAQVQSFRFALAAAEALENKDPRQALTHLDAVPPELRDWIWRHLHARLRSHIAEVEIETSNAAGITIGRSADQSLVACMVKEQSIEVVDLLTGDVQMHFEHESPGTQAMLSPDARILALSSKKTGNTMFLTVPAGTQRSSFPIALEDCDSPCFSPDGTLFAVSVRGKGLHVFETATGNLRDLSKQHPIVDVLTFSPDGKRVAYIKPSAGGGHDDLVVIPLAGGPGVKKMFAEGCTVMCFAADGKTIAFGSVERNIWVLDSRNLEVLRVLRGHGGVVSALALSADGEFLASSSRDSCTRIWDLASGKTLRVLLSGRMKHLAFSQDSALVAGGSATRARLWAWRQSAKKVLRGHENYVYFVAFSPDGSLLASSSWDRTVRLWGPLSGELLATFATPGRTYRALAFNHDGTRLIASSDHDFTVWDPLTGLILTKPASEADKVLFASLEHGRFALRFARAVRGRGRALGRKSGRRDACDATQLVEGTKSGLITVRRIGDDRELAPSVRTKAV